MISITISPGHPVTIIVDDDERRYHFGRLINATNSVIEIDVSKALPRIADLIVIRVIVETFGQLNEQRFGTVDLRIDCQNVSVPTDRLLRLALGSQQPIRFRLG